MEAVTLINVLSNSVSGRYDHWAAPSSWFVVPSYQEGTTLAQIRLFHF
jgi:hypothetical protein